MKVVIKDDQANPAKAQTVVREMIDQDKVVAIAGYTSTLTPWDKHASEKGVPVAGGAAYTAPSSTDPNFFPAGTPYLTQVFGLTDRLKELGKTKLAPCCPARRRRCAPARPTSTRRRARSSAASTSCTRARSLRPSRRTPRRAWASSRPGPTRCFPVTDDATAKRYALKDETLGGLVQPLNYTKGKPTFLPCWYLEKPTDDSWDIPSGQPKCMTPEQQKALFAAIGAARSSPSCASCIPCSATGWPS